MKSFRITEIVTCSHKYEVKAKNRDEAIELHSAGQTEYIPEEDSVDYFQIEVEEICGGI